MQFWNLSLLHREFLLLTPAFWGIESYSMSVFHGDDQLGSARSKSAWGASLVSTYVLLVLCPSISLLLLVGVIHNLPTLGIQINVRRTFIDFLHFSHQYVLI